MAAIPSACVGQTAIVGRYGLLGIAQLARLVSVLLAKCLAFNCLP